MLKQLERYIKFENIDAKLRYLPIARYLRKYNIDKLPILEVGSGVNGISDYYSGEVIGVDADFSKSDAAKNSNIIHKKGDITNLPFPDKSFKYVICLDTLEHLPKASRKGALVELIRVTKEGGVLFLGFPQGKLSSFFERVIDKLYFRLHKRHHLWLIDHLLYKLPTIPEIDLPYRKQGNVNLLIWFLIHLIFSVVDQGPFSRMLKIFKFPLEMAGRLNIGPFYRVIYIIQK